MITIRFDPQIVPAPVIHETAMVRVDRDSQYVTAESEKNRSVDRVAIDRVLRPLVSNLWNEGARLFRLIGIETRAGCNAACDFCPVNKSADLRTPGELDMVLIQKLADELEALHYQYSIQLFGNNEPLLDGRIVDIVSIFHRACPEASIGILTNGTKLSVPLASSLFAAGLSVLTINNYTDGIRLTRPTEEIINNAHVFECNDIRISVRRLHQVLTNRAARAPNKKGAPGASGFCALPFVDLQVDYRGRVVTCCFDTHSDVVIGDISEESVQSIWYSDPFRRLRGALLARRRDLFAPCRNCDFDGFADPYHNSQIRLTREELRRGIKEIRRLWECQPR